MKHINNILIGLLLGFAISNNSFAANPSFNCSKATELTDLTICANDELAELDIKNSALYNLAKLKNKEEAIAIQKSSYKEKMACGSDVECIKNTYEKSIALYQGNAEFSDNQTVPTEPHNEETAPIHEETPAQGNLPAEEKADSVPAQMIEDMAQSTATPSETSQDNQITDSEGTSNNSSSNTSGALLAIIGLIASCAILIFANSKKGSFQLEKRDAIARYFKPFPYIAVLMILIGSGLMASQNIGAAVSGLFVLVLGTWIIFNWIKQPTDQQMDAYIAEDLETVKKKSLSKSDIDESQLVADSLTLTGFRIDPAAGAEYKWKKGKDGEGRFTPINITSIIMTDMQLVTYNCALDLLTGNSLNETTDEYFYKDVVSVSTETSSATFVNPKTKTTEQFNTAEFFKLTTSGGTSVKVFLKDPKLIEMMGQSALPGTDAEKAIQSIRKMLREKKQ